jgi:hypothetical protein
MAKRVLPVFQKLGQFLKPLPISGVISSDPTCWPIRRGRPAQTSFKSMRPAYDAILQTQDNMVKYFFEWHADKEEIL